MKTRTRTQSASAPDNSGFISACVQFAKKKRGGGYMEELALFLAKRTGVKYILVGYPKNLTTIQSAVLFAGGQFIESYSYALTVTATENITLPSNTVMRGMFPPDDELKTLGIESYIGLPVFDEKEQPLGVLALMDTKIIENPKEVQAGLNILARPVRLELKKLLKKKLAVTIPLAGVPFAATAFSGTAQFLR